MTVTEFLKVAADPDNESRWLELVRGELVAHPPGGHRHAATVATVVGLLHGFARQIGVGAIHAGIIVQREPDTVRCPDYAILSATEFRGNESDRLVTTPPRLAVEVVGPEDTVDAIREKLADYLAFKIPLVWIVDPKFKSVSVIRKGQPAHVLGPGDMLNGDNELPGFECNVADFFRLPAEHS